MLEIALDILPALLMSGVFFFLYFIGKREKLQNQEGWGYILLGFAIIIFGMLVGLTGEFPALSSRLFSDAPQIQGLLEKFVGYCFGFVLLAVGVGKWIPKIAELRRSRERLNAVIQDQTEMIIRFTRDDTLTFVNSAYAKFLKKTPDELVGYNFKSPILMEDWEKVEKALAGIKRDNPIVKVEYRVKTGNDSISWQQWTYRGLFNSKKEVKEFQGVGTDVSERKQIEADLQKAHHELKQRVEERTAELMESNWRLRREIDERRRAEADRRKLEARLNQEQRIKAAGALAAGIAHEFNNLLQVVAGNVQLLLMKKVKEDPERKYLEEIDHAEADIADLVHHLQTFSSKIRIVLQDVDMNATIEQALKPIKANMPKSVSIETHLAQELPTIKADFIQIEKIIRNLANNAFDAMPEGGRFSIETEKILLKEEQISDFMDLNPGEHILIKVSDTGVGMDKDIQAHVFEPLFTTKEGGRGTGIGLSSVYGIVKAHNGHISCYSLPQQGTMFNIYLPVKARAQEAEEVIQPAEPSKVKQTVMIVDDEEIILGISEDLLKEYGYDTLAAKSGEEALVLYEREKDHIDLIILDLGMPGMSGEACLRRLLRLDPDVKVIVASGFASHEIAKDPALYGAVDFVSKPYRVEGMIAKVRKALGQEQIDTVM